MTKPNDLMPRILHENAIEQTVNEEMLLYVPETQKSHYLKAEATQVYQQCNGRTSRKQVAAALGDGGNERLELILEELGSNQLINIEDTPRLDRRAFLAAASKVGLALPLITTLTISSPAAAQSAGCVTPPCAPLTMTGGASGNGPSGCTSCCGPGALGACTTCPGDCPNCSCLVEVRCSNDGVTGVLCNTTGADICQVGSNDFVNNNPTLQGNGCIQVGVVGGIARSCSAAKAGTPAVNQVYFCCECP